MTCQFFVRTRRLTQFTRHAALARVPDSVCPYEDSDGGYTDGRLWFKAIPLARAKFWKVGSAKFVVSPGLPLFLRPRMVSISLLLSSRIVRWTCASCTASGRRQLTTVSEGTAPKPPYRVLLLGADDFSCHTLNALQSAPSSELLKDSLGSCADLIAQTRLNREDYSRDAA